MGKDKHIYHKLRDKWIRKHRDLQQEIWIKHGDVINDFINNTKNFAIGSISGLMLLSSPALNLLGPSSALTVKEEKLPVDPNSLGVNPGIDKSAFLIGDLAGVIPQEVRSLTPEEEEKVGEILSRNFGMEVKAELEGKRLNTSYGYIGAEQHLARYPGDTMGSHFNLHEDSQKYHSSGMAPGLGAWGYFSPSREQMTEEDSLKEKYYIAAQTFLAPGFAENTRDYITFFKHRKMLIINPHNGRAIVVVIGDAGPAEWTGKSFGGSPEVMKYLERVDGRAKGPVLCFFINDPGNKIPLGPIEPV